MLRVFFLIVLVSSLLLTPAAAAASPAEPEWGSELVLSSLCMNNLPVISASPLGEIVGPLYIIVDGPGFDHRTIGTVTGQTPLAEFHFTDQLQPKAEYAVGLYRGYPVAPEAEPFLMSSVWTRGCGSTIEIVDLPDRVVVGQPFDVSLEVTIPFTTTEWIGVWPLESSGEFQVTSDIDVEASGATLMYYDVWMNDEGQVKYVLVFEDIADAKIHIGFQARALQAGTLVYHACVEDVDCVEKAVMVLPTVTILATSTTDRVDFRVNGVDCSEVVNLPINVMGFRYDWNEYWFEEVMFVEDCRASIDLLGYSVDGRTRFYLPDWPLSQVTNLSDTWEWNSTGGYFEQVSGSWVRWLVAGMTDLPIWVTPSMGENLGLVVVQPGVYRVSVDGGRANVSLCDTYPCPPRSQVEIAAQPTGSHFEVYLHWGEYYLAVTTDDAVGGLYYVSFERLTGGVYLPLISR